MSINMPLLVKTNIQLKLIFLSHIYRADLCDIDGKVHIVCVDYFSFFIWERPLPDMQSDTVILGLKMIFSENGSPQKI